MRPAAQWARRVATAACLVCVAIGAGRMYAGVVALWGPGAGDLVGGAAIVAAALLARVALR